MTGDSEARRYEQILKNMPEAGWVREMREYYYRTGAFRAEDLRRLIGNPSEGVIADDKIF
jgi:hypothetical protein